MKSNTMGETMKEKGSIQGTPSINLAIPTDCRLKYIWVAEFKDGSLLGQFDEEGNEIMYREVMHKFDDLSKLHFTSTTSDHKVTVELKDDMRPICFRRHIQKMSAEGPEPHTIGHEVIYCLGFQKTVKGVNIKTVTYIKSNGDIVICDE